MHEALNYRVVLTGELVEGRASDDVAQAVSRLFKKPPDQVRRLFCGKPHPINSTFDYAKANALRKRILEAGAQCVIEPVTQQDWDLVPVDDGGADDVRGKQGAVAPEKASAPLSLKPGPESSQPAASHVTCPKCGHEQTGGTECEACGIIFAKYQARPESGKVQRPKATRGSAERRGQADVTTELWDDLLRFVGPKANVYAGKFRAFGTLDRPRFAVTWHWPAFLVPFFWALYRKLWPVAALVWIAGFFVMLLHPLAWLAVNIASGLGANYVYYRDALSKVKNIHRVLSRAERPARIAVTGGASPMAVYVGIGLSLLLNFLVWKLVLDPFVEQLAGSQVVRQDADGNVLSSPSLDAPEEQAAAMQISMLSLAVKMALIQEGGPYAASWEQIMTRMRMRENDIQDPWGTPMRFEPNDSGFELRSAGPDRAFDSGDDLIQRTEM
jgi:hypothetical protein